MSDEQVVVPFGDNPQETAILLLDAAEKVHSDQSVVQTSPFSNGFQVPADVAKEAGLEGEEVESDEGDEEKPKKAPAKKSAKKK